MPNDINQRHELVSRELQGRLVRGKRRVAQAMQRAAEDMEWMQHRFDSECFDDVQYKANSMAQELASISSMVNEVKALSETLKTLEFVLQGRLQGKLE